MTLNHMSPLEIYQLRIVLKYVSPIIWRRILVADTTSIADLHNILQIILEWNDDHLNKFIIHGKEYGVYHDGGISFLNDPKTIYLKDFQFHPKEKFTYEYNFNDGWEYEIRFEKAVPVNTKIKYPYCLAGGRSAPPEDCGGPLEFLKLDQYYSVFQIGEELIRLIKKDVRSEDFEELEDEGFEDDECDLEDRIETLKYWANRNKFNRRKINTLLQMKFNMNKEETKHAS